MVDVDKLAGIFASGSCEIEGVYRLVIQPQSILRDFRTVKHGLLFPVRGKARMRVDGTVYEMHPGAVLHAAPGMQLDSQVLGQSEYEYYSILYRPNDKWLKVSDFAECGTHFKIEPGLNSRVIELLAMLHHNIHAPGGLGRLRVMELFLSIMHQVLVGCSYQGSGSPNQKVIEEAVAYIHGHYMHPLTLDELAELHAMSPKRFSYFFHKYTGFRPIDYVIHYRMERACELLKAGHFSVKDVASSVGYANPLYFSRLFKKKTGRSPSAYMEQCDR